MGIYKSTDAGKTWTLMGLEKTGRIARVVIDPHNPNIVFAAAMGHSYGPQPERGLFRTSDGGKTWERVLFVDENTGCSDVAMDPKDSKVLFAGMWQFVIHTWAQMSGGAGERDLCVARWRRDVETPERPRPAGARGREDWLGNIEQQSETRLRDH
jgi:hypothetical protein